MSRYYFRISHGRYAGTSDSAFDYNDDDEAWTEMTRVCGDLLGSVARALKQNSEWHMELLDESKAPLFRIRLLAEKLA
jgi:hypothetical protein